MMRASTEAERVRVQPESSQRYPRNLLRRVAEQTGFSYRVSALDLSNDGGELAVELARMARTVTVALDDDSSFAVTSANIQRHNARAQLRVSDLAQLAAEGARYWLVTIGRPLHLHGGKRTLEALDTLVERGGSVAVLGSRYPRLPENTWRFALEGSQEHAHDVDEGLLLGSRFDRVERVSVFERCSLSVDQALAQFAGKRSAGELDRLRRSLLAQADDGGMLRQLVEGHALIARREGDRSGRWS
jgi:hypothetical protein